MMSGHPLSDTGRDVTKLGNLALNAAKAQPLKAAALALVAGLTVGLAVQRRGGKRR
jgi:hypothetical protein